MGRPRSRHLESSSPDDVALAKKLQDEEDRRHAELVARRLELEEDRRLQARLNAWEALEEESDAAEQAMAGFAALSRRSRSSRGLPPMFDALGMPGPHRSRGSGTGGWGPMSLGMLLAGPWQGRQRRGPTIGDRGIRDMVTGFMESGLPPHLLFSDRDFTPDDYEALCRLDEKVENRKGASQKDIDALPTHVARDSVRQADAKQDCQQSCPICLEDVVPGAVLRHLPCTHRFHQSCIDNWLKQRATCPICLKPCNQSS